MTHPPKRALRNLTREDLELIWNRRDIPLVKIAAAVGVSRQALTRHAVMLGLPSRGYNQEPTKKGDDARFIDAWQSGVRAADIAQAFGFSSTGAVSKRRKALGLPARSRAMPHNRPFAADEILKSAMMREVAR